MAEPLSISMAAIGILGALNSAVNSVEFVYSNVKTWKKAKKAIEYMKERVKQNRESLVAWREEWMAWEEDEPFCQFLWGEDWISLRDALNAILLNSKELSKSIEGLLRSSTSCSMKTKFVFMKKKYLKDCIDELAARVTGLRDTSWEKFCSEYNRGRERKLTPSRAEVQTLGNLFQMVRLCLKTGDISQTFHGACLRDRFKMVLDLELDFFGTLAEDRSKAISKAAAKNILHFKIFAKESEENVTLIKTLVYQDSSLSEADCKRTFSDALKQVFSDRMPSAFDNHDGSRYRVKEIGNPNTTDSQCYRLQMLSRDPSLSPNAAGHPSLSEKIKLALDLVEAGLLFLKTSWFAGLCTCSVRHWQLGTSSARAPLLRTGSIDHVRPHRANLHPPQCWCDPSDVLAQGSDVITSIRNEHIRLLGIVLTEIMTDCPVLNVRKDQNVANRIELDVVTGTPPAIHTETLERTLSRVRQATSERCKEAVEFCLESTKTPTEVEKTDVEKYYWKVLLPIEDYYKTLTKQSRLPSIS